MVYFPGAACVIVGTAVWPPGHSVSFVPPGFASVLSKRRCQIWRPAATSMPYRSSDTPATTASSRGPCAVVTRSATSGANRLCIARGVLSRFTFHRSFMLPTLVLLKIFSSRTQPVRALSTPSVRKSDATPVTPDNSRMSRAYPDHSHVSSPFVCEANRRHRQKKSEPGRPVAPQSGFGALGATPPKYSRSFCASIFFTSTPGTFFRSSTDLNRPCLSR